jgi:hypothetical protein
MTKSYHELIFLPTFNERLKYLATKQRVSDLTFNGNRYLNQALYNSHEWKKIRRRVIIRDLGCDLALPDYPITSGKILIHHINPITAEDVLNHTEKVFDMDNLVCVSFDTHQLIHYGVMDKLEPVVTERKPNDTCPWKE